MTLLEEFTKAAMQGVLANPVLTNSLLQQTKGNAVEFEAMIARFALGHAKAAILALTEDMQQQALQERQHATAH